MTRHFIPVTVALLSFICAGGASYAAPQCRGTKIVRQCSLTDNSMMCSSNDSLCQFMARSNPTKTCYSFQVPCAYHSTNGLFEGLDLLQYPIVGVQSGLPPY